MNSLYVCLNAVTPIFLIMAAGYAAKCAGFIKEEYVPWMNGVLFKVFIPIMCFYNIYSSDLSQGIRPFYVFFLIISILIEYILSLIFGTLFVRDTSRRGVVIQGLYRSNFLFVGIPLAASLLGEGSMGVVAISSAIVAPMFNILAVITLEAYNGKKPSVKKLLFEILKNPLIIGCELGILVLALGIHLPAAVESAVSDMGRATSPMLLFLLGAFFRFSGSKEHMAELVAACVGRLIIFPGIALGVAALLNFHGAEFVTLLVVFSSSTAIASFTMAQQMGGDANLAGDIVVMTSALCSFTLFLWSFLFMQMGLF